MEVHHHSHTSRKKWTHYFWEFLMLFLAVFCGFLAEFQLEHKIERNRARQYISSFYEDLIQDTTRFAIILAKYKTKISKLESLQNCYQAIKRNKKNNSCMDDLLIHSLSFEDINYTDRTLQQLKNAGGFRLLDKEDADSIFVYDGLLKASLSIQFLLQEAQTKIRSTTTMIYNVNALSDAFQQQETVRLNDDRMNILNTSENKLIDQYFNELVIYFKRLQQQRDYIQRLHVLAAELADYFKRKYNLKTGSKPGIRTY